MGKRCIQNLGMGLSCTYPIKNISMLLLISLSNGGLSSKNLGLRVAYFFENRA